MIDNPHINDWQLLQANVYTLLNDIGLNAEVNKKIATPRGHIDIDVYAVDQNSVDKIRYIVECKNWNKKIPQSVIHSFTTIMHETGGNIGFIISKKGFQSGARTYLKNTNIQAFTYLELQERYFETWWNKYFCFQIGNSADSLIQYVELINSRMSRRIKALPQSKQLEIENLRNKYLYMGERLTLFSYKYQRVSKFLKLPPIAPCKDISAFKDKLNEIFGIAFVSVYYRDLTAEILNEINKAVQEFEAIFEGNTSIGVGFV